MKRMRKGSQRKGSLKRENLYNIHMKKKIKVALFGAIAGMLIVEGLVLLFQRNAFGILPLALAILSFYYATK